MRSANSSAKRSCGFRSVVVGQAHDHRGGGVRAHLVDYLDGANAFKGRVVQSFAEERLPPRVAVIPVVSEGTRSQRIAGITCRNQRFDDAEQALRRGCLTIPALIERRRCQEPAQEYCDTYELPRDLDRPAGSSPYASHSNGDRSTEVHDADDTI